jgi:hypothetical protein
MIYEIITATSPLGHKIYFHKLIASESGETTNPIVRMCSDPSKAQRFRGTDAGIYPIFDEVKKCYPDAQIQDMWESGMPKIMDPIMYEPEYGVMDIDQE